VKAPFCAEEFALEQVFRQREQLIATNGWCCRFELKCRRGDEFLPVPLSPE